MRKLDQRQIVPLTSTDLAELRTAAETREMTTGLFSRALHRYAMDHLGAPELEAAIEAERVAAAARLSAGARKAVAQRWGNAHV